MEPWTGIGPVTKKTTIRVQIKTVPSFCLSHLHTVSRDLHRIDLRLNVLHLEFHFLTFLFTQLPINTLFKTQPLSCLSLSSEILDLQLHWSQKTQVLCPPLIQGVFYYSNLEPYCWHPMKMASFILSRCTRKWLRKMWLGTVYENFPQARHPLGSAATYGQKIWPAYIHHKM